MIYDTDITIIIPSFRRRKFNGSDAEDFHLWDDLRLALLSVACYAPRIAVLVGWDGPFPPDSKDPCWQPYSETSDRISANVHMRLVRRPDGLSGTAAFNWCVQNASTRYCIMMNDDAVLHPSTVQLLREDWTILAPPGSQSKIGFLGCRSNFVAGAANIRQPNSGSLGGLSYSSEDQIIPVTVVYPVCALFERLTYLDAGGLEPSLNWYSDNLLCFDLCKLGYRHFVSRAYVHHIGMRGSISETGQSMAEENERGLAWLRVNRPDYFGTNQ